MERVSKQIAIELKKLGYDVPANENYFEGRDESRYAQDGDYANHNKIDVTISAPYLDEVIDWLDSKGIHVNAWIIFDFWQSEIWIKDRHERVFVGKESPSRSAAKIAGITKALELLKNK